MADNQKVGKVPPAPGSSILDSKYLPHILSALGAASAIVPPLAALRLPRTKILTASPSAQQNPGRLMKAIENAGGQATPEGLSIDLLRHQKPEQVGAPSRSGGVFYTPSYLKDYSSSYKDRDAWGGPQDVAGKTLLRNPYFAE